MREWTLFFSRLIERAASIWLAAVARVSLMPFIYHQVLISHHVYTPGLIFRSEFLKDEFSYLAAGCGKLLLRLWFVLNDTLDYT